jgi:twitching motility protein PilT
MRDLETINLALTAAETGHLVLATLHTGSAAHSINRIIDVFPAQDKGLVRSMLSSSLQAIISQKLIKKTAGGRCAAFEVMLGNNSVKNLIREDKIPQIASIIEISKKYGMISMKDSIAELVNQNLITPEAAEEVISSFGQF